MKLPKIEFNFLILMLEPYIKVIYIIVSQCQLSSSGPYDPLIYVLDCPDCNQARRAAIKPCQTPTDCAGQGCPYGAICFRDNGETEGHCACKLPCKLNHIRSCLLFSSVDMFISVVLLVYVPRQQLWPWRDG